MSASQPTPREIEEKKVSITEMKEDVPLIKYKKKKADEARIEQEKAEGQAATSLLMPATRQPRKKLAAKKLTRVTQDLKEVEAVKAVEAKRIRKKEKKKVRSG